MNTAYAELLNREDAWPPAMLMAIEVPSPTYPHWHDFNPWGEFCVYVTPEELAACHRQIGKNVDIGERGARMVLLDVEQLVDLWKEGGNLIDAYILPDALVSPGLPSAGVRYGTEGYEYLTPFCDTTKLLDLLKKHGWKRTP